MKNIIKVIILVMIICSIGICEVEALVQSSEYYINDFADILSKGTEERLKTKAKSLYVEKGITVLVVTVDAVKSDGGEAYAASLAKEWNITEKAAILLVDYNLAEIHTYITSDLPELSKKYRFDTSEGYDKSVYTNFIKLTEDITKPEEIVKNDNYVDLIKENLIVLILIAIIIILLMIILILSLKLKSKNKSSINEVSEIIDFNPPDEFGFKKKK